VGEGPGAAFGEGGEGEEGADDGEEGCCEVSRRLGIRVCEANRMFCRYANDKDMNDELRAVERADDPAAAFLTVSSSSFRLNRY
jgi:hypothetical protein